MRTPLHYARSYEYLSKLALDKPPSLAEMVRKVHKTSLNEWLERQQKNRKHDLELKRNGDKLLPCEEFLWYGNEAAEFVCFAVNHRNFEVWPGQKIAENVADELGAFLERAASRYGALLYHHKECGQPHFCPSDRQLRNAVTFFERVTTHAEHFGIEDLGILVSLALQEIGETAGYLLFDKYGEQGFGQYLRMNMPQGLAEFKNAHDSRPRTFRN